MLLSLFAMRAAADEISVSVLLDTDDDAATGCAMFGARGFELSLTTSSASASSGAVWRPSRCDGDAFARLEAESNGRLAAPGSVLVIEGGVPLAALGLVPMPRRVRLALVVTRGGVPLVLTNDNGRLLYLATPKRRAARPSAGSWRTIIVDGRTEDWTGIEPLLENGGGDQRTAFFVYRNDTHLYVRFDAALAAPGVVAEDDAFTAAYGRTLEIPAPGVLANDSSPAGELEATPLRGPVAGALTLRADGGFTYVHEGAGPDTDSFTYRASAGGGQADATVTLDLIPNALPAAAGDAYGVSYLGTLVIAAPGVLTNDSDADGDPLTAAIVSPPEHGTLILDPDGSFTYVHAGPSTASDSFSYTAGDGRDVSAPAVVSIEVQNGPPLASDDAFSLPHRGTLTVEAPGLLLNDVDPEGESVTAELLTLPAHGSLTVAADGSFTYTHDGSDTTDDTFTYTARDAFDASTPATVTLTIGANAAPTAADDGFAVAYGGTINVAAPGVLANDSDPEGAPLQAELISAPLHGTLTLATDGSFVYQHDYSDTTSDAFTYRAHDGLAASAPATVTIAIAANLLPQANADAFTMAHLGVLTVTAPGLLANDVDPEGRALNAEMVTLPAHGTLTLSADGSLTYAHDGSDTTSDSFTYRVSDGLSSSEPAVVTLAIAANLPPVGQADAYALPHRGQIDIAAPGVLANDSDPEGAAITATEATPPQHGVMLLLPNGRFLYRHDGSDTLSDSFTYTAGDPHLSSAPVTVSITVGANTPPVTADDSFTSGEGSFAYFEPGLFANDSDAETPIALWTFELVAAPSHGTFLHAGQGRFYYLHDGGESTSDSFSYRVHDGLSWSNVASVTMTITPVSDPPVAYDDFFTAAEDVPLTITRAELLANDLDPDTAPDDLVITITMPPYFGTLVENGDGTFTYTTQANSASKDVFEYTIGDGLFSSAALASINVTPVDDPPEAVDDTISIPEGYGSTFDLRGNDVEHDVEPLLMANVTNGSHGTATIAPGNLYVIYTHDGSETTQDTFTYRVSDGITTSGSATVTVNIQPVNDWPTAQDDSWSVAEGATLNVPAPGVLANDSDPDSTLTVQLLQPPVGGTLTLNADGSFQYVHDGSEWAQQTFVYRVSDGEYFATAWVTLSVVPLNDPPIAADDSALVTEGLSTNIFVTQNDSEPDGPGPQSVVLVQPPAHGTATAFGIYVHYQHDGSESPTDSFTYQLSDGVALSAPATVNVTVNPVDDLSQHVMPPAQVGTEDVPLMLSTAGGNAIQIADVDGTPSPLQITINSSLAVSLNGTTGLSFSTGSGSGDQYMQFTGNLADINAALDGMTVLPPYAHMSGSFGLRISTFLTSPPRSEDSDLLNISFASANDPPEIVDYAGTRSTSEDTGVDVQGFAVSDVEAGWPLPLRVTLSVTDGAITIDPADLAFEFGDGTGDATMTFLAPAAYINARIATIHFVPAPDFAGDAVLTIVADDLGADGPPGAQTASLSVDITVLEVSDPPKPVDDAYVVAEGATLTIAAAGVLSNDLDDGGTLLVTSHTPASHGTVTVNADGSLQYVHDGGESTSDQFDYTVSDGGFTADATVFIDITAVDDPPTAVDDTVSTGEDTPINFDPRANDADVDGGPRTIVDVQPPSNGVATISGGTSIDYTPAPDFCGNDALVYELQGGSTATVTVTVSCLDDPPAAAPDDAATTEEAPVTIDVITNDLDPDGGAKAVDTFTQPAHGSVSASGPDLLYQPAPDYCNAPPGTTLDTFSYTLAPGGATAQVSVTVTCADDFPTAADDDLTVVEDSSNNFLDVLANESDVDGGPRSVSTVSLAAFGTVTISVDGSGALYTPPPDFCTDSTFSDGFQYTIQPGGTQATALVHVTCVDDPPTANGDSFEAVVTEDAAATPLDVLANDGNADGGPLTIDSVTPAARGVVQITSPTSLTYQASANLCGLDSFTYTLAPGGSTATVQVVVTCADDPPTAVDDAASVSEDAPATPIDVLPNDADIDSGPRTVIDVTQGSIGAVAIGGAGAHVTYRPNANACNAPPGTTLDTFTYTLNGGSVATVTMTVNCVDDPPVADADTFVVAEESGATLFDVLLNDDDVDGGPIEIASVTQPANGTVAFTATDVSYTPDADYCNAISGVPDLFTYTLTPGSSQTTVSVTVTCSSDGPTVSDATIDVPENTADAGVVGTVSVTDPDPGETFIYAVTGGTGTAAFDVDASGNIVVLDGSLLDFEGATTTFTLDVTVTDSTTLSDSATITLSLTNVNESPEAGHGETFTAIGNTWLEVSVAPNGQPAKKISGSLLANEADPDAGDTLSIVAGGGATAQGGSIAVNADGSFRYLPAVGFLGTDSYVYTVRDAAGLTATATLTLTLTERVWYVRNNASGPQQNGRVDDPESVLSLVENFSADGDTIYVHNGTGTNLNYGDIALKPGQNLIGEGTDLVVDGHTLAVAGSDPHIGSVTLADDVTARGFLLDHASAGFFGSGVGGTIVIDDVTGSNYTQVLTLTNSTAALTMTNCSFGGGLHSGAVEIDGGAPDVHVSCTLSVTGEFRGVSISNTTGGSVLFDGPSLSLGRHGIDIANSDGDVTIDAAATSVSVDTRDAISVTGDSDGSYLFNDATLTVTDNTGRAINVNDPVNGMSATITLNNVDALTTGGQMLNVHGLSAGSLSIDAASSLSGNSFTWDAVDITNNTASVITILGGVHVGSNGVSRHGVDIFDNTGTPVTFGELDANVSDFDTAALEIRNSGKVTSTGGDLTSPTTVFNLDDNELDLTFDSINGRWADLDGLTGSLTIAGGSMVTDNSVIPAFDVTGGTLSLTYGGSMSGCANTLVVTNHSTGTMTFSGASNACGLYFTNAGGTYAFTGATSAARFDTLNSSGTFTFGVATSASVVQIEGGTPQVSFAGSAATNGSSAFVIQNLAAGANVEFSGNLSGNSPPHIEGNSGATITFSGGSKAYSTGSGPGVRLTNNAGSQVSFTNGGLHVTSSGNNPLRADTGGMLVVSGPDNRLSTTNAIGLSVDGVDIGAAGLTFENISMAGANNGIVVRNTGALGGLTVTGDGSPQSGGDISSSFDCVILENVKSASFTSMYLHNCVQRGIDATGVDGLTLADSEIVTTARPLALAEITGTISLSGSTIAGTSTPNITLENTAGVADLFVDGLTASGPSATNAMLIEAANAATINADIRNSAFTSAAVHVFHAYTFDGGTLDLTIDNVAFSNSASGRGVLISNDSAFGTTGGAATAMITNSTFTSTNGSSLFLSASDGTELVATVQNNTFGPSADHGLSAGANDNGTLRLLADGNGFSGWVTHAIDVVAFATGTVNATVTGNTTAAAGQRAFRGFATGSSTAFCLELSGNDFEDGAAGALADVLVKQDGLTTMNLPGYGGAANDTAAVAAFIEANNPGAETAEASIHLGGWSGGAACPTP